MKENKIDFKRLSLFLIISISLSNVFRFNVFNLNEGLEKLPTWIYFLITAFLDGSGVFIGAIISIYLLRKQRGVENSLHGTSRNKGLLMSVIPILLLTIIGVKNEKGHNPHLYGFIFAFGSWIYCILEEYGWRGYLQEEFKHKKPLVRYLLIGFLWYFWHLIFLGNSTLYENLFILGMMILGSWGIGKIAELTKSIVASACFHLIIQIMMFNSFLKNGIDLNQKLIILGTSILLWIIILRKWDKETKQKV
jgi:uncharacterized protein